MFKYKRERTAFFCVVCLLMLSVSDVIQASLVITDDDIIPIIGNEIQSGNGLLDLKLFADSNAHISNETIGFNGDDANRNLPVGNISSMAEAYITSMGDIRDFYDLAFGPGVVHTIGLFVDTNQTGKNPSLNLDNLSVIIDYDTNFGDSRDDPETFDVHTNLQNLTTDGWSWNLGDPSPIGGTVAARLDSAKILALNNQGAGWADYVIDLGIDPYDSAYSDQTRVLIYWESSGHNAGGETIFLSSAYEVPEPASLLLLGLGAGSLLGKKRRHF